MIELLFVACLRGEPATCENRTLQFADLSLMTCMMAAQPELARWQQEHPIWMIKHWTCAQQRPGRST